MVRQYDKRYGVRSRLWMSEQGVPLYLSGTTTNLWSHPNLQVTAAQRFRKLLAAQDNQIDLVNYYELFGVYHNFDTALVCTSSVFSDCYAAAPQQKSDNTYTFTSYRPAYCYLTGEQQSNCRQDGK